MRSQRKLRVAFVTGGLGLGGAERQLGLLVEHLDRSLFDPRLIGLSRWSREEIQEHIAERSLSEVNSAAVLSPEELQWLHDEEYHCNLFRRLSPHVPIIVIQRKGKIRARLLSDLFGEIRRFDPDVVQTWGWLPHLFAAPLARAARVPVIVHSERSAASPDLFMIRLRKRVTDLALFPITSAIVTNSRAGVRRLSSEPGAHGKVRLVENGIQFLPPDSDATAQYVARFRLQPTRFRVAIIGRLDAVKNHEMFLDALEALKRFVDFRAVIVGDGPLRPQLEKSIARQGLSGSTEITGWLPDIRPLLDCVDAVVMTSHFEGFPNALAEAMTANVPIIATAVPGICDLVSDDKNGLLVPLGDHLALAAALTRLSESVSTRVRLAGEAQRRISRCSVSRMARRFEALYACLASESFAAAPAKRDSA